MPFAFSRLYKRLGTGYFWVYAVFESVSAFLICLSTVGLFSLYNEMSTNQLWDAVLFADFWVAVALLYGMVRAWKMAAPLIDWVRNGRTEEGAVEAWRTAVTLPRRFVEEGGWQPFAIVAVPVSIFFTIEFGLPFYSVAIIFAGTVIAVAYAAMLHFFASELFLRPVAEDIARRLPIDLGSVPPGVPLRWKLLGALPMINVVTGVVVSGLSTDGRASLNELGVDVVVALLVAFTVSLELTLLLTRSILTPVEDLLEATERVRRGELDTRVPITSADELGALAASFNEMVRGLAEREALREAFGSYVDPEVARRVVEEGELLEGQEREVTVMFVDVRGFTPFAERASARETVAFLNEFFDLVVPIVRKHGGHANKFLGDGLLCVFGAPERLPDHADRALAAAREIVSELNSRFGERLRVGIGLNSGPVVAGSVGGGGRLEFTVIGDPVNVAARVEEATRETGDTILLTEATRCLLEREVELEERGEVSLRGKSEPVPVYSVPVEMDERSTAEGPRLTTEA
jgi:adenylate cyclase